ncbi:MAG TPA: hypothetical protein VM327_07385 [Candidatus Thermoplasmatota archaeon]|nr:hypothetical protein [Candidatus Thermoplasmatota archaeon]
MAILAVLSIGLVGQLSPAFQPRADSGGLSMGTLLADAAFAGGTAGMPCPGAVATRVYGVVALPMPISYNNWGDFDPHGRLFVPVEYLEPLAADVAASLRAGGQDNLARAVADLGYAAADAAEAAGLLVDGVVQSLQTEVEAPRLPHLAGAPKLPEDPRRELALAVAGVVNAAAGIAEGETQSHPATAHLEGAANGFAQNSTGVDPANPADLAGAPNLPRFAPVALQRPYVARAHLGECVVFNLLNALPENVGMQFAAVQERPGQGMALGSNALDLTPPGAVGTYTVYLPSLPGMEGAHLLTSPADPRFQTKHGLFGALVAEPPGTGWTARDGNPDPYDDQAIVVDPDDSDYREFVTIYHDEAELFDHTGKALPVISPYGEYGPGSKAINLRSEPFMDRFQHVDRLAAQGILPHGHDKSQGYGSYAHGDPATYTPVSYLGDPVKQRLSNVGPGQHHVHHLHGGGIRWRASPVSEDTQFDDGLLKDNPVHRSASERVDVQTMGPGESFNAEPEGGSGGVQRVAGDFLFHCHVVEHYVGGMWGFWRVFNTLQAGLAELPDRAGGVPEAVGAQGLVGKTMPGGIVLTAAHLGDWVERQLPAQGVPSDNDASVWDWSRTGGAGGIRYLGEPESHHTWPNYRSATPGKRPEIMFNPLDGKVAYPLLRPHLGARPPFAPGHGPAPYLTPDVTSGHPDGLCPAGARSLDYRIVALATAVSYNARDTDPDGQIFVHAQDKTAVLDGTKPATSMVLRANQGDCVDVTFTSQLREKATNPSKANMHIHLVQFDVQASDGVITGMAYEQSVRPAAATGTTLAAPAIAGATAITVANATGIRPGTLLGVGLTEATIETRTVAAVSGSTVALTAPLALAHAIGERVGYEFVRYRWYPDVELGMVYWHDHVDGLNSWRHGLFGGLVVEPAGSQWCDPKRPDAARLSCTERRDGHLADIVAGPGGSESYRELVVQIQDRGCLNAAQCTAGGIFPGMPNDAEPASLGLRSEPLGGRNAEHPLASWAARPGSSVAQGDPATDLLEAYPRDPVVVRLLYAGQSTSTGVGTFAVTGHRFAAEQHNPGSRATDAISLGISSQHNLRLDGGAGGPLGLAGDYLYGMTQPELLRRGAWGVLRVDGTASNSAGGGGLQLLPNNLAPGAGAFPAVGSPGVVGVRHYDVVAMHADVSFNDLFGLHTPTRLFALAGDEAAILNGTLRPTPLVLRALPGEIVEVTLSNHLPAGRVSLNGALLQAQPGAGYGVNVGRNVDDTVGPGGSRTYRWLADREVGAAYLTSLADPAADARSGLYGSLVVEPAGSAFSPDSGASSTVTLADGRTAREHVLLYATNDAQFESSSMPYLVDAAGLTSINYRSEPLWDRVGGRVQTPPQEDPPVTAPFLGGMGVHSCQVDAAFCGVPGSGLVRYEVRNPLNSLSHSLLPPETPILDAGPFNLTVVRSLGAAGDQLIVHGVQGHWWALDPDMPGCRNDLALCPSNLVGARTLGVREADNAWILETGRGGAGDYLYGNLRQPFHEAGAWGLLRVCASGAADAPAPGSAPPAPTFCGPDQQATTAFLGLRALVGPPFRAAVESASESPGSAADFVSEIRRRAGIDGCTRNSEGAVEDGDISMPPEANSAPTVPGFFPGCVILDAGGTLTIHNRDHHAHIPASLNDLSLGNGLRCFTFLRDVGGFQLPLTDYALDWRYDGTDLEASADGGLTWRDCNAALDPGQTTAAQAFVPIRCDIHTQMRGAIVVEAAS